MLKIKYYRVVIEEQCITDVNHIKVIKRTEKSFFSEKKAWEMMLNADSNPMHIDYKSENKDDVLAISKQVIEDTITLF